MVPRYRVTCHRCSISAASARLCLCCVPPAPLVSSRGHSGGTLVSSRGGSRNLLRFKHLRAESGHMRIDNKNS